MKSQECRRNDDVKRISKLEGGVARLRLQRESYTYAAVQTTNEEDKVSLLYERLTLMIIHDHVLMTKLDIMKVKAHVKGLH